MVSLPDWLHSTNKYDPVRLHAGDLSNIQTLTEEFDREIMEIRPYRDSDGIEYAENLISVFNEPGVSWSWLRDKLGRTHTGNVYSFEMWFSNGKLRFYISTPNEDMDAEVRSQIGGTYPDAEIKDSNRLLPSFPDDGYIAGGRFDLSRTEYAPVKSFSGPDNFDIGGDDTKSKSVEDLNDPYRNITSELIGHDSEAVMVQIIFRTAPDAWVSGRGLTNPSSDLVVRGLQQGMFVDSLFNPRIEDPTEKDKKTAEYVGNIKGMQAFDTDIRYFVVDPDRENCVRHAKRIEGAFSSIYKNDEVDQQLVGQRFNSDEMRNMLLKIGERELGEHTIPVTKGELAALAHIPNGDIDTDRVDWIDSAFGGTVPGDANTKQKRHLSGNEVNTSEEAKYAEADEYAHVSASQPDANDSESLYEKAKRVVTRTEDAYYREEVTANDYPVTDAVAENVPEEKTEEFMQYSAAYERGDITEDDVIEHFGGEEHGEKMVALIEEHIKQSYLAWAESNTDNTGDNDGVIDQPALTDGDEETLPDTATRESNTESNSENPTSSDAGGDGYRDPDNLPDTRGKHAVAFRDIVTRKTRTENGDLATINFQQTDVDGNPWMGEDIRELFVDAHSDPGNKDDDVWIGYQSTSDNPTLEVGWSDQAWFRHKAMFGTTGMGKSTLLVNEMNQIARKGYGFVCIDPSDKGDLVSDLMQTLPEHRLQDVVWIQPGDYEHDRVAAINFLETSVDRDNPRFDREVESIVDDLQKILKAGKYWGPKMAGITKNITRAMVRSTKPYTMYDMYNVLSDEESRFQFAESIEREGVDIDSDTQNSSIAQDIKQYSERIAEMDTGEDVDPVIRRLQDWAESPISKEIVSHRFSSIDIQELIDDGKIILVKNNVNSEDVKRVISTAVMRRVWVAIQVREETTPEEEINPYFAFLDEFHEIVSKDMNIKSMLARARSGKLSVTIASQNPSQIEEIDDGEIMEQVWNNTDTLISFAVRGQKDLHAIADRFGEGFEPEDMKKMPPYRAVTQLTYKGEHGLTVTDPLDLHTFAPYPPVRTRDEADEAIQAQLEKHGVIPMNNTPEETELLVSGGYGDDTALAALEALWGQHVKHSTDTVPLQHVITQYNRNNNIEWSEFPRGIGIHEDWINIPSHNTDTASNSDTPPHANTDDTDADTIIDKQGDTVYLVDTGDTGSVDVQITPEGIEAILFQDSGRGNTKPIHRRVIRAGFRWLSRLGYDCFVPEQAGAEEVCDGKAVVPINEDVPRREIQAQLDAFTDNNELAVKHFGTEDINIEAETTTRKKPARTIENLARGYNDHKHVVFIVEDGRAEGFGRDYHAERVENILKDPPLYKRDLEAPPGTDPDNVADAPRCRLLYNRSDKISLGDADSEDKKFALIPKGRQSKWVDTGDGIELYVGSGSEAEKYGEVKYSEVKYGSANAFNIWCRYDPYEKEWIVYTGGGNNERYDKKGEVKEKYTFVRGPLYPEQKLEGMPDDDEWSILITPDPKAAIETGSDTGDAATTSSDSDGDSDVMEVNELDTEFPPSEVPLLYDDGDTQALIPEENESLLTGDRTDNDSTGDESDTDVSLSLDEVKQRMSALQQIKLKEEVKNHLNELQREQTEKEKQRLHEFDDVYGAYNPGEIKTWLDVWDHFNRAYETGIPGSYLPQAFMMATGLTESKAEDAVEIGEEFDILVEGEAQNTDALDDDIQNDSIYRITHPKERPHFFVDEPARFTERDTWADAWNAIGDTSQPLKEQALRQLLINSAMVSDELAASAALHIGEESEAITYSDTDGYELLAGSPERVWLDVWEANETDIEAPMQKDEILVNLRIVLMQEDGVDADERFETGVRNGEIYSPDDCSDDEYVINDPGTDAGPDAPSEDTDDDDDDDGDGGARNGDNNTDDDSGGAANTNSHTDEHGSIGEEEQNNDGTTGGDSPQESEDPPVATADTHSSENGSDSDSNTTTDSESGDEGDGADTGTGESIPSVEMETPSSGLLIPEDKPSTSPRSNNTTDSDSDTSSDGDEEENSDNDTGDDEELHVDIEQSKLNEHYENARPVYEELGSINRYATQLVYDYVGWYKTEDNEAYNPELSVEENPDNPCAFQKKRRPINAVDDLDHILDEVNRSLYALTTYKSEAAFNTWKAGRWNAEKNTFEYSSSGTPTANWEDTRAMMAWGDIDLPSDVKADREDLDSDTKQKAERIIEAYIKGFQTLYGSTAPVYALDSVGGLYVMGAPTATLPIVNYFRDVKQDEDALGMVFEEFRDRTNEHLKNVEENVAEMIDGAGDVFDPDWCNNVNRQYKAPLSVHKDLPGVVTPIDVNDVSYEFTHIDDVTDELIEETRVWAEGVTDTNHKECVEHLVAELWPEEYAANDESWQDALAAWVENERERIEEEKRKRREAREDALQQTDDVDDGEVNLVKNYVNLDDAVGRVSTEEVVRKYACDAWDTGIQHSHKVEFNPGWRQSESGSSCFVNTQADVFSDPGMGGGGYADKAIALVDSNINYNDPSDDLNGETWGEAVNKLRDMGYNIPYYIPDVGSPKRHSDGTYDRTPNWAMKKAAVLFGVCTEDDFVTDESGGESFERLSPRHYAETVDILQEDYGYTVTVDESGESGSDASESDGDVGSGDEGDEGDGDSERDDVADMSAVLGDGGAESEVSESDSGGDGNSGDSSASTDSGSDSVIPDDVDDVDVFVLNEFVDEQCSLTGADDDVIRSGVMMEAFVTWVERRGLGKKLDKLAPSRYVDHRKGDMKTLMVEEFDVDVSRRRFGEQTPRCFIGIDLDGDISDVISVE